MFIIIPWGHEYLVRRKPLATYSLIGVNVVVFLLTYFVMTSQMEEMNRRAINLIQRGVQHIAEAESNEGDPAGFLFTLPEIKKKFKTPEDAFKYIRKKLEKEPDNYEAWLADYREFREEKAGMLINRIGFVPEQFPSSGLFTHMFVHGGWLHLIFNMWFLYLVGVCLEDTWGRINFVGLYLLGGLAAALIQFLFYMDSATPMVGASGAVAAVMGAFAIRLGKEKINCLFLGWLFIRPIIRTFRSPAWLLLGFWFVVQLFYAHMHSALDVEAGVAFWAHAGGFIFGAVVAFSIHYLDIEKKVIRPRLEKIPEYQDAMEEDFIQDARLITAMDFMSQEKYTDALIAVNSILQEDPQNMDARLVKARTLDLDGKTRESESLYVQLMEETRARGDRDFMASLYEEYLERFKKMPPSEKLIFAAGRFYFKKGEIAKTRDAFMRLQNPGMDPEFAARALFFLARMKLEFQDRPDQAKELFGEFLEKHPHHAWRPQAQEYISKLDSDSGANHAT